MSGALDAVVIGSGPNGLAAAVALAQAGAQVLVLEAAATIGGGTRTAELTLPGFRHDLCSAVHPLGILSPYLRTLPLAEHGLEWIKPLASVAHPLDDQPAVMLWPSLERTAAELGVDGPAYRRLLGPCLVDPHGLLADMLAPLRVPRHPLHLLRFGLTGLRSARGLARGRFAGERARALLAGCAAHAIQPLEHALTAAVGLMFLFTGHVEPWPVAKGGSAAIAQALASLLTSMGGKVQTGVRVRSLKELPPARAYLFDTSPDQVAELGSAHLPAGYRARLGRYRYGPGVFKLDWALSGAIPWRDANVALASTVHVGGPLDEICASERAMWQGEHSERPFVLLCQQSQIDPSRAPPGQHTGYAYCHVPAGSSQDMTEQVERQVERFAPGFRQLILARQPRRAVDFAAENPNYVGGAITGGVSDLGQLFSRPVLRANPYRTPHPRLFMCSASTPPGGGVHGMSGYFAAQAVLSRLAKLEVGPL